MKRLLGMALNGGAAVLFAMAPAPALLGAGNADVREEIRSGLLHLSHHPAAP
jgi:hypothetical protein